jgi:hypothetical protein
MSGATSQVVMGRASRRAQAQPQRADCWRSASPSITRGLARQIPGHIGGQRGLADASLGIGDDNDWHAESPAVAFHARVCALAGAAPRGAAFGYVSAMEHAPAWLTNSFIYLSAAVIAVPLSRALGLGAIIGYLAAGIAIGPWGLGWSPMWRTSCTLPSSAWC